MDSQHIAPLKLAPNELAKRLQDFEREYLRTKSADTVGTYRRALNEFERWFAGQADAACFSEEGVRAYKTHLVTARSLSEASVSTYLTALRQFCKYLVSIGLMDENPARNVRGSRRPSTHSREALTEADVEQLLEALDDSTLLGKRDQAMVYLMLYAGLSEIEMIRADARDIEHTLLGGFLRVQGKGRAGKDRQVLLDPPVVEKITAYLEARSPGTPEQPLFVSHGHRSNGQRLNTRSVRSRINRLLTAANLKRRGVSPHSLTHTAPLIWLGAGMDIEEVQTRMRHGTLETTRIYFRRQGVPQEEEDAAPRDAQAGSDAGAYGDLMQAPERRP